MSFWTMSDGNAANTGETEYESDGGFVIIPEGSNVLASIESIGWAQDNNFNRFISARWNILKPDAVAGVKIFQKLWVTDADPQAKKPEQKRDKALKHLGAMDANAGGKLGRLTREPTDDDLALALTGKPMVINLRVWDNREGKPGGNWVNGVYPKTKPVELKGEVAAAPKNKPAPANTMTDDDDDIPF